jgi:hypothetical protein
VASVTQFSTSFMAFDETPLEIPPPNLPLAPSDVAGSSLD